MSVLLSMIVFAARATGPTASVRADLDGDGVLEAVTALAGSGTVELQVRNSSGRTLAAARPPAPPRGSQVALHLGALGAPGSLVEVVASNRQLECRSLWRYRSGGIARIPIIERGSRAVADCEPAGVWTHRWEPSPDRPAAYVRERTRPTADGTHHQRDVFRFSGFSLELDAAESRAEIAGVPIPEWSETVFYARPALESLHPRYDLAPLKASPKLRLRADRNAGAFELRWLPPQDDVRAHVVASAPDKEGGLELTLRSKDGTGKARALLAVGGVFASELTVSGLGERLDHTYVPATRFRDGTLYVYGTVEDEISAEHLPGRWVDEAGRATTVSAVPGEHFLLHFGDEDAFASLDGAPPGTDLLLRPRDGSAPRRALDLRGRNVLVVVPVRCSEAPSGKAGARSPSEGVARPKSPEPCEVSGPGETLRREGALLNLG